MSLRRIIKEDKFIGTNPFNEDIIYTRIEFEDGEYRWYYNGIPEWFKTKATDPRSLEKEFQTSKPVETTNEQPEISTCTNWDAKKNKPYCRAYKGLCRCYDYIPSGVIFQG